MPEHTELLQLAQALKRAYAAALRPVEQTHGLTRNEVDVLLFLANNPGCDTARDMVELRGLTKAHVCRSVEHLAGLGFLEARRDGRDRRVVRLKLLPAADAAVDAARAAQQTFFHRLWRGVAPEEDAVLERVLGRLSANLKEGMSSCC